MVPAQPKNRLNCLLFGLNYNDGLSMEALYIRDGDYFVPTERTGSPWDTKLLHGGAIAGLLAYAVEHCEPNPQMRFVRITNDLFRPAPRVPIKIETRVVRDGQRIGVIQALLIADGKEVAMATALRARVQPIELPDYAQPPKTTPRGPEGLNITSFLGGGGRQSGTDKLPPGLHSVVEMKIVDGFQFRGAGTAWLRINAQVVAGEDNTPLTYMGMMSDFGNGLGQVYLGGRAACINADIDMHLNRYPQAQAWIGLASQTHIEATGFGTTQTSLYDEQGPIGHVSQSLVVRDLTLGK